MKIQIQIKPKEVKVKTHFWMKGENCVHFVKQNSLSIHINMKTNHRQGNRLFKFFIVVCREVCGTVSELLPFPVCLYPGVVMDNPWSVFLFPFSLHLRETHSMFQTAGGNQTHPHSCIIMSQFSGHGMEARREGLASGSVGARRRGGVCLLTPGHVMNRNTDVYNVRRDVAVEALWWDESVMNDPVLLTSGILSFSKLTCLYILTIAIQVHYRGTWCGFSVWKTRNSLEALNKV